MTTLVKIHCPEDGWSILPNDEVQFWFRSVSETHSIEWTASFRCPICHLATVMEVPESKVDDAKQKGASFTFWWLPMELNDPARLNTSPLLTGDIDLSLATWIDNIDTDWRRVQA